MLASLIAFISIEEAYGSTIEWHKNVVMLVDMYNHIADKFHHKGEYERAVSMNNSPLAWC